MSNDLYLHSRWICDHYADYDFRAIAEHPEATSAIREMTEQYFVPSYSLVDLSCLFPEDLYVLANLGARISTFSSIHKTEASAQFERAMGYIADWMEPDSIDETVSFEIADSAGSAIELLSKPGDGDLKVELGMLRELDTIGAGKIDSGDPFAVRSWFLAGPGPRVFAPGRASEVSLVKENRIERFMTDQLASEPGSLERRLIEVYENDRDKRYETLASCLVGDSSQTGEPAILRELSELTLEAASNGSFLVLSGF